MGMLMPVPNWNPDRKTAPHGSPGTTPSKSLYSVTGSSATIP